MKGSSASPPVIKGEIPNAILKGTTRASVKTMSMIISSIFGDRLYFELQDNGIEEQKIINEGLIELSSVL